MSEINILCKRWLTAKDHVRALQEEMLKIELELLDEVESVDGGSKTSRLDGYKITVKKPINRTIDGEAWEQVKERIPAALWPIRVKVEPDPKGCDWLAENRADLWLIASEAITERAGKPGFTIEEVTE